jgi:hypothetical protein
MGPWEQQRRKLERLLRGESFKAGGIRGLGDVEREAGGHLLGGLAQYGIFVVPTGELESWLPELEVGGHGPEWLTRVFARMGTDPEGEGYMRPRRGDVWEFMLRAAQWVADPERKGMQPESIPAERLLPAGDGPAEEEEAESDVEEEARAAGGG